MTTETSMATLQYLTFSMAGEEYAMELVRVREILEFGEVTVVPRTPHWLRGVINLRGSVVPIVDLARKLELPESPTTRRTCIIVVESTIAGEDLVIGVIAEAVNQVIELAADMIVTPPSYGTAICTEFILGMAKSGPKFTLLLDIDGLLTRNDVTSMTACTAEPEETAVFDEPPPEPLPAVDDATGGAVV